ncbi:MAG: EamA family transporter [Bryobacteraceae bacterium]|nr:EamA family transporter [Bryobacteraceae bacterium]
MIRNTAKALSERSVLLVFLCTLIGAAAQVLFKLGSASMTGSTPVQILTHVFTSPALLLGFACYGINTLLLVLALRKGELSMTYPIISLTYVWVSILSVLVFHESMNGFKIAGLGIVVAGVAVLGRGGRS